MDQLELAFIGSQLYWQSMNDPLLVIQVSKPFGRQLHQSTVLSECPQWEDISICCIVQHSIPHKNSHQFLQTIPG